MNQNKHRFSPLMMAICVVIGILIGTFYANHFSGNRLSIINSSSNKLNNLLHIINDQYVDTVNVNDLVEKAMPQILAELDPHSVYISAKDVQQANDDLRGSFSGVGIEFTIRQDTLHVQQVISNGPAERAGVIAGDKIVMVDDKPFTGKTLTNEEAMHRLKGPKDTKVKLGILRYGETKVRSITVTRGEIPTKSVTATYMLDSKTGYIRIKNFGENTYPELLIALAKLSQESFQSLCIDLRGNTGGYLQSAVQIANEFLPKNRLIVYTQGRKSPRQEYRSDGRGSYQHIPLIILIDETSASASEILAGAIQDNDRGTIVGRRSYGKGLVQEPFYLSDDSGIRLTVARYYTPSGRCIQKPYRGTNYDYDIYNRYADGEVFSADSVKLDRSDVHYTRSGREVYGGGGIMPDVFVPMDTTRASSFFISCNRKASQMRFASAMFDKYVRTLTEIDDFPAMDDFLSKARLSEQFRSWVRQKDGLSCPDKEWEETLPYLEPQLNALVSRYSRLGENAFYKYYLPVDKTVSKALSLVQ